MAGGQEDNDPSQKTEEPTHKRLQDARKKGQVAVSREVNSWLILFSGTVVLLMFMPSAMSGLSSTLESLIGNSYQYEMSPVVLGRLGTELFTTFIRLLAGPFALLVVVALLTGIVQNGIIFAPESIQPKLEKISPISGMKRLFSLRQLLEFVKGIFKIVIIGMVGLLVLLPISTQLSGLVGERADVLMVITAALLRDVMMVVLGVLFVIAMADLAYQRYSNRQKLRMTRQEVKEEFKNTEGDPQIKARLRRIRQERARRRMMQALPKADVVITNPTHYAVALQYDPQAMPAPVVVAKGLGDLALRIREKSTELQIPLVENPPLARLLYDTVEVDQEIPSEHYKVVAEVISYVWSLRQRRPGGGRHSPQ